MAATNGTKAILFTGGSVVDLHATLPGNARSSQAFDVADDGTVVGKYSYYLDTGSGDQLYSGAFLYKGGSSSSLSPGKQFIGAHSINNVGQVTGGITNGAAGTSGWVRNRDGSMLRLEAFPKQRIDTLAINDLGAVVGGADMNPDPKITDYAAFRTEPGQPIDVQRDRLNFSGSALAYDINNAGQVAGYGRDRTSDEDVPVIWDKDGFAYEFDRPGVIVAINNAGIGVGVTYAGGDGNHAALYANGQVVDLNNVVSIADRNGMILSKAAAINDQGLVAGVMVPEPGEDKHTVHAFLLDLKYQPPVIESVTFETQRYPSTAWVSVPTDGVTDGNKVRVTVSIRNPDAEPAPTHLILRQGAMDGYDSTEMRPLPGGSFDTVLAPYETVKHQLIVDTAGMAWTRGASVNIAPATERFIKAFLFVGGILKRKQEEKFAIRPKPLVLVHGWMSNAAQAWSSYAAIAKTRHPLAEVFAVGDGKALGTLNTGDEKNPSAPTNTLDQNVAELAKYIEEVRWRTGAWQIDLLAHSFGGLISRQYIATRMPINPDGKQPVNRLLQMGTPNLGARCADMLLWLNKPERAPAMPALKELSTKYVQDIFNQKYGNSRGVPISVLVGTGITVPCSTPDDISWDDGDGVVAVDSARYLYPDQPHVPNLEHGDMTLLQSVFDGYVLPRIASRDFGNPSGAGLTAQREPVNQDQDGEEPSVFASPSVTVEPGKTASVPLEVPQGAAFGVTTKLPVTAGLLLRDPTGRPATSYAPDSAAAKRLIQGLNVADPQAGRWQLEITNTGSAPVEADLVAWVAGNPVTVAARLEEPSKDGRVGVTGTVTDGGQPMTGVPVTAVLIADDNSRHELTLKDDGASGDGAADDGVYGATSEPLADGVYAVMVKADTAKGTRTASDAVEVKKPDLREFALTLSAQPGGSVSASPTQDGYQAGTKVTIMAKADAGLIPLGWIVDGEERPGGPLTLVMDGPHKVVARFGSYTVTELGGAAGEDPAYTRAVAVNDRGQVAVTIAPPAGLRKSHAARWEADEFTDLGGLTCTDGVGTDRCNAGATGINEAGDVSGWATASTEQGREEHAVVYRSDGSVTDLQPDSEGWALDLNDSGQVFGQKGGRWTLWDQGVGIAPATSDFHADYGYSHPYCCSPLAPRMNTYGAVAGGYVTRRGVGDTPTRWTPAVYEGGKTTALPIPKTCQWPEGLAYDINLSGTVAGQLDCGIDDPGHAYVWRDGQPTDLGEGRASAVNDGGLVAGFTEGPTQFAEWVPALWLDNKQYKLADLLPRPLCPEKLEDTTVPCIGVRSIYDMNSSGQIVAQGFMRDRSTTSAGFAQADRSFLLTPTTARADLEVTTKVSAAEPGPTSTVTWTATVANKGPETANDVRLDILIPATLADAAECETWRGTCTAIKGGFRNTATLKPGWQAKIEVSVKLPADMVDGTELKAEAYGYSLAVGDPKPDNNAASVSATVRPLLDKTAVNWPTPVRVGSNSDPVEVTLTNRLNDPIPLKVIAVQGPFAQSNSCPVELAVGATCTVTVTFTPTSEGAASGKLTFTTADGAEPAYTVTLTGTGAAANAKPLIVVPSAPLHGTVGQPFTLSVDFTDADAADKHTAEVTFGGAAPEAATVKQRAGGGTVTATTTFTSARTGMAAVFVSDGKETTSQGIPYVIEDAAPDTAPVVTAGPDAEVTVGEKLQRSVSFTDADSSSWTAAVDYGDGSGVRPVTPGADKRIALEHQWASAGTYTVTVTVKDDGGLEATGTFTVTVKTAETPNEAPKVTLTGPDTVAEGAAWRAAGSFTDPDSASWTATVDYGDGAGPRKTALHGTQLTLEHIPADNGDRAITVTVTDDKGATGTATLTLHVTNAPPQVTLRAPQAGKVVAVGEPMSLEAAFTDPGTADTHTAVWTIGGRQVTAAIAENGGKGTVGGSYVFTKAGRYPISVTVTDDDGAATTEGQQAYVLVYDPAGSLVGAGQTVSPAGACTVNAECGNGGKTTFNVTARYRHGEAVPTGGLHYDAPGFDLRDTAFAVLAAADGTAVLRGTGKVNKTVHVTYEITAIDGGKPADRTDRLVVRVWNAKGEPIYDNSASPSPVTGTIRVSG
ncbi:choice-of-anchor D domain-containing protein [Microbispora sp. NEAU-D428]|uniref:PKD domain-containing protein n=1 Tax=Microbispora sitophila TaxID=2771537 RepID=UPI0018671197|nr:PKD domain-containing protein [Microbispora sitophila]MBE3012129.1 choice-of-anchor D domain-containing protein [Microbispora sitophila]